MTTPARSQEKSVPYAGYRCRDTDSDLHGRSPEIDALSGRCQLAEKRMRAQRPGHTNLRPVDASEEERQA